MNVADERVLRLLKEARERLEFERGRRSEPIAIVGIGCRFPGGASGPERFWDLLVQGVDATSEVPSDRWDARALYDPDPTAAGKCYTSRGAFLEQIDGFEPEFFGISPREARSLDPQQRLLLEVTWEALENAGILPGNLRGSRAGVWIGLSLDDYVNRSVPSGQLERIDAYSALGIARSVAAGRIAYVLGVHGPVMQLDTACSSSLVAIHLACQSLRAGECDLALVGGVNVMSSPEASVALCKLQALARDGRCKTFDEAADGYGRGEGCGIVVLKPLSTAQAAGDRIYAVIRGSAVNHDGASNGLTAPNGLAQEAVIRSALANAGLSPSDVAYVEAHGTGTLLGDPIEVLALNRVYGAGRAAEMPLYVGSVKTNVGHLEAAAGIAALIKTTLCLRHARLTPHLHLRRPNPKIPWQQLAIRVTAEGTAWPAHSARPTAGVSAFGISGTNAHVLLEAAPETESVRAAPTRSAELIVLSTRTPTALKGSAETLRKHLAAHPEFALGDLAYSLMTTRSSMDYSCALAVPSMSALRDALTGIASGSVPVDELPARRSQCKVAFVFPGQGSQWVGMGRQLLAEEPTFRQAMEDCEHAIRAEVGWSLLEELQAPSQSSRLEQVEILQPVLFAVQVALAALWRSWGVEPDVVVGHSMGEVAAACVAGALSLEDGVAVICRRSALLRRIGGQGEMALIELSDAAAKTALAGFEDRLSLAVINSHRATVLSGESGALNELLARFEAAGVFCRRVKVGVASHSPQVEPLLAPLRAALAGIAPRAASVPMHSTVSGALIAGSELDPSYWADNLRHTVRFAEAIDALLAQGITLFIELSPHPVLVSAIEDLRRGARLGGIAVGSLRREQPERLTLLDSLGALHTRGLRLHAARLFSGAGRRVELPSYPWQRERYWLEASAPRAAGGATRHPLLGVRIPSAAADAVYESVFAAAALPWLSEHRVAGRVIVPAAALAELVRAAAEDLRAGVACEVTSMLLAVPLFVDERSTERVQVVLTEDGSRASVYSQTGAAAPGTAWVLHVTADLAEAPDALPAPLDLGALRGQCLEAVDIAQAYESLAAAGLGYGSAFRGLKRLWRGRAEALAEIQLDSDLDLDGYGVHPALLDAALQALVALAVPSQQTMLPCEIGRFTLHRLQASSGLVHVRLLEPATSERLLVDVTLCDGAGQIVAALSGVRLQRADLTALSPKEPKPLVDSTYRVAWLESAISTSCPTLEGRWAVVATGDDAHDRDLVSDLRAHGASAQRVGLSQLGEQSADHVLCSWGAWGDSAAAMAAAVHGLAVVQALVRSHQPPRLWWLTRSAVAVEPSDRVLVAGSSIWGLGRTVVQEHPELRSTLLDLEPEASVAQALLHEVTSRDDETQIAWRGRRRFVSRLVRSPGSARPWDSDGHGLDPSRYDSAPWPKELNPLRHRARLASRSGGRALRVDGTFLITRGLGALGLEVARVLARRGVQHLLLSSRGGQSTPAVVEALAELRALGARVSVAAVDVADRASLSELLLALRVEYPLRGVVHAAGLLDDGMLAEQTPERLVRVMAPKVLGAWNLHILTEADDLDLFVLFSSIAGTFGSAGQGGYAAGNTFLDALAAHRRAQGLAGLSLAWGPWAELGLAAALNGRQQARFTQRGVGMISPQQGSQLFDASLARSEAQLVLAPLDMRGLSKTFHDSVPAFWRALVRTSTPRPAAAKGNWALELRALSADERVDAVTSAVRAEAARVLSLASPSGLPLDKPLKDLGLDSLMAVELGTALSRRIGATVPAMLVFHHPTARAIAAFIVTQYLAGGDDATGPPAKATAHCEPLNRIHGPQTRLFCFHNAGGSPAMFVPFCELGCAGIEVHAVSHARHEEPTRESAERYLLEAVAYIRGLSEVPYGLFGHSLGGFFAWRVLEELAAAGARLPALFVPSAAAFPWPMRAAMSPTDLSSVFQQVAADGPQSESLRQAFAADVNLWRLLPERPHRAFTVPIAAFVGREDPIASEAGMRSWAGATTDFSLTILPGSHSYVSDAASRGLLLAELDRRLAVGTCPP